MTHRPLRADRPLRAVGVMLTGLWLVAALGPLVASAQTAAPVPTPPPSSGSECVGCHAHPQIMAATGESRPELFVRPSTIAGSVHASFSCITCHSPLTATMHDKLDAAKGSCQGCHQEEAKLLAGGAHGSPGAAPSLTCVSCHGNHAILPVASKAFYDRMTTECAMCHTEMGERFFGGNPFGMETHLGRTDVATCWDCHQAHLVLPTSDPRSPVNPANILTTCRHCHVNAPSNFADIEVHVASSPLPDDHRLRAVTLYMILLLVATFGFFGYHTVLQIRHELQRRSEHRATPGGHP